MNHPSSIRIRNEDIVKYKMLRERTFTKAKITHKQIICKCSTQMVFYGSNYENNTKLYLSRNINKIALYNIYLYVNIH